jgi:hypothetical protein
LPFIQRLCEQERTLLARLQQIELSAVRLFGLFPIEGTAADLADLFHVVGTAGAADVVDFSLQLMPSLLETKRRPGAQRFSIDGFASVETRGNVDALLPSELAHDDDVFLLKALSDDLLYYGHERQNEVSRPLHYILVDGSASMRGAREVFARGLALALAKKLSLVGGKSADVWVRFFDSRLHPRIDLGRSARRDLPRLLSFRSQRGRNYARVFADLAVEVGRMVRDERPGRGGHLHHARHLSDSDRHGQGTGGAGPAVRHLRVAVGPAGARLPAAPAQEPGRDCNVAGAHRRETPARAGDRRGRREHLICQPRNRSRPASGPSRRSARAARARRWSFIASCSNTTRPRAATTRRGSTGRRRRTSRSGRGREAGYVLLTLGRYGDAQRHFPVKERPLEWALCAARMGRRGEAARVFSEMGHPALAAIELEAAGAAAAARLEWERVLRDERLAGRPYETALAHLSLGEALVASAIARAACASWDRGAPARGRRDEYETGGDTERAFDCYRVLLQLGRDMGSFETVAEGYLNMIRIMATLDQERTLQYYDDFIAYAVENKEHYAAAMAAREVAEYSLRMALVYDRHYLERAAELWVETAHANQLANGPVDLAANAFQAAIDAATALGDLALAGRIYGELAELPLPDARRRRYRALARRYESEQPRRLPAPAFPAALRKKDSYKDIWRDDLIEWELDGDPIAVLARLIAENSDTTVFTRPALRALLKFADPKFSMTNPLVVTDAAEAVGKVPAHEVLRSSSGCSSIPRPRSGGGRARCRGGVDAAGVRSRAQGAE